MASTKHGHRRDTFKRLPERVTPALFGYIVGEFEVPLNAPDQTLSITVRKVPLFKKPVAAMARSKFSVRDVATNLELLTMFYPDTNNVANMVAATVHRFGCEMPRRDPDRMQAITCYAVAFILRYLPKAKLADLKPHEEYLKQCGCHYGQSRISVLRELRRDFQKLTSEFLKVKSFIKNECYPTPKQPRAINSPSDLSKTFLGPLIQMFDKTLFKLPWFVKGTNPREWPRRLKDLFRDDPVIETDFSSFEAHHTGDYAHIVHFAIMHYLRDICDNATKRLISKLILGTHVIEFKYINVRVKQRLMSGALWTSSANGLLNLILMSYMILQSAHPGVHPSKLIDHMDEVRGVVEGDDGLFYDPGVDQRLFGQLGLRLEFERHTHFSQSSFCGIICDPDSLTVVTDPIKVLGKITLIDRRYVTAKESTKTCLVRAKALSYMVNYSSCPIIGPLCHRICELTRSYKVTYRHSERDAYHADLLKIALEEKVWMHKATVPMSSRLLVEKHFKIPIQTQLDWEARIGCFTDKLMLDLSGFYDLRKMDYVLTINDPYRARHPPPPGVVDILRSGLKPLVKDRDELGVEEVFL